MDFLLKIAKVIIIIIMKIKLIQNKKQNNSIQLNIQIIFSIIPVYGIH